MLSNLFFNKKKCLGIDISSTSVKLLEFSKQDEIIVVENYAFESIPEGAVIEKEIKDVDAVAEVVNRAVKRAKTKFKYCTTAIAGANVITRVIQLDNSLNEDEIEEQIKFDANKYIPYPTEEVNMDFDIIEANKTQPENNDILLAATRRENIEKIQDVMVLAGIEVKVVDIDFYAMERALSLIASQLPDKGINKTIAIVDIGSTMTTLNVFHDRQFVYTREQMFGGLQLTEEIQRRYGLTYEEAQIAKIRGGLPDDYMNEVLEPFKQALVQQISRGLQFLYSSTCYNEIDLVLLAGGSASIPGIDEVLEEQIGVHAAIANPFAHMRISKNINKHALLIDAPSFLICAGLALRSINNAKY